MYKSKLQEMCHKKKWALPKYSCMRDGPDHNAQFKASVVVNGVNFDTQTIWKSLKEAHNEAAKFALLHFTSGSESVAKEGNVVKKEEAIQKPEVNPEASVSIDASPVEITKSYKHLLEESAKKEGLVSPTYSTIKAGSNHDLKFISMVEFNGETFCGQPAMSKKQAKINAAMVARTAFLERDLTGKNSNSTPEPVALPEMTTLSLSQSSGSNLKDMEMKSYILCNRVKVYTSIPEMLPEGTILLPVGESKWVAASLEFAT